MKTSKTHPFLLSLPLLAACAESQTTNPFLNETFELKPYASCEELESDLSARLQARNAYYKRGTAPGGREDAVALSGPGGAAITNRQEADVDEADLVKASDTQLFVARAGAVEVLDRAQRRKTGTIALPGLSDIELFLEGARLVVTATKDVTSTWLGVFETSAAGLPSFVEHREFQGTRMASRLSAGRLALVLNDFDNHFSGSLEETTVRSSDGRYLGTECDRVYRPLAPDFSYVATRLVAVDLASPTLEPREKLLLGGSRELYATSASLYLVRSLTYVSSWGGGSDWDRTRLVRIEWPDAQDPELRPVSSGDMPGTIKDRYALKEYLDGAGTPTLYAATTTWDTTNNNHLMALQERGTAGATKLEIQAHLKDFGLTEDIRAVRYLGDRAYVVTFKKTDPLFAFDLSDRLAPRLLGELKVPGFSNYLHPWKDGKLLGVGLDADDQGDFAWFQGVQVSLFDVNAAAPTRLDVSVLGKRGSQSAVNSDPRAFWADANADLFATPVTLLGHSYPTGSPDQYGDRVDFAGSILWRVERDHLEEVARVSHSDLRPSSCPASIYSGQDVLRSFVLDGRFVSVSAYGAKFSPLGGGVSETAIAFAGVACDSLYSNW